MITFVDLTNGEVLDVVDGRDSAAVGSWLAAQPRWWRRRVQVVAIDPSAAFRSAVRRWLPKAASASTTSIWSSSATTCSLVSAAGSPGTSAAAVVAAPTWPGRTGCCSWVATTPSPSAAGPGFDDVLAHDDPTREIGAAWGVKEQPRLLLKTTTLTNAAAARARFDQYVTWAQLPETTRLKKTIDAWWPQIETFIETRATNAKTEAGNVTIKNIKRTGRGYRSPANYRSRIMLYNAARSAA